MKKYITILAAAACALFACQKNEIELLEEPIIKQIDENTYSYTFSAIIADDVTEAEDPGTKASITRAGVFSWAEHDALRFYRSNGTYANAEVTSISEGRATITVTTDSPKSDFVSAVYPAAAGAGAYKVSFNARGPIVVSDVTGGTLTFYHIGSLINLKFTSIPVGTASLVFEPASAFGYDGTFSFTERVPSLTATGTTSKIVVPATTSDSGNDITVCVPSVVLSTGFSAAFNDDEYGVGSNLYKKTTTKELNLATSRPVLLNMKSEACTAPRFYYISTTGTTHTASYLPMIKTGSTTYQINLQMDANATYKIYDEFNKNNASEYVTNGTFVPTLDGETEELYIIGTMEKANWDKTNKDYQMKRIHGTDWCVCKSVKFNTASAAFKIYTTINNWDAVSYHDAHITVGTAGASASKSSGGGDNTVTVSESNCYDVFLNTKTDSYKIVVVLSSDNYNPLSNNIAGIHSVIYDTSDGSVSLFHNYDNRDNPWADDNVKTKLRLIGYTSGWTGQYDELTLTYDGNEGWYYRNLVITSDGEKGFKFKINGDDYSWYYNWGQKDGLSVNAGTNNYGAAVAQDATGNNTITLTTGTYDVYLNAYSWYDNKKMNYMFIKH